MSPKRLVKLSERFGFWDRKPTFSIQTENQIYGRRGEGKYGWVQCFPGRDHEGLNGKPLGKEGSFTI